MADKPKNLHLDREGLQRFIDEDVQPFIDEIVKLTNPDGFAPSLSQILGKEDYDNPDWFGLRLPLSIGLMAEDGDTKGKNLSDEITKAAQSVLTVLTQQQKLFKEFKEGLEETCGKLLKSRDDSLEKIDGERFLDKISDVDSALTEAGQGGKTQQG
ncbi:type VII secretion system-associated protein [Streptomyces sp. NPDC048279]|uniref:type VII secretion system-associated protein n=1 Tax=Streptomyces sp. NPDC048279 TaxID=3154714 RepID=UPI00342D01B4